MKSVITKFVSALIAPGLIAVCINSLAASLPEPVLVRGTQVGMPGPNLIPDSSFQYLKNL